MTILSPGIMFLLLVIYCVICYTACFIGLTIVRVIYPDTHKFDEKYIFNDANICKVCGQKKHKDSTKDWLTCQYDMEFLICISPIIIPMYLIMILFQSLTTLFMETGPDKLAKCIRKSVNIPENEEDNANGS